VRSIADRVGVMFRGELVECGAKEDVFKAPFHPYTHSLLLALPARPYAENNANRRRPALRTGAGAGRGDAPAGGCVYAGRCRFQLEKLCSDTPPPLQRSGASLDIRCHIPIDELAVLTQLDAMPSLSIAEQEHDRKIS
jgi:peptide/nickel transport system ATP-binding protein